MDGFPAKILVATDGSEEAALAGRGGIRRALMGSVSESVVRHAHCPVLVVRPEARR